MLFPSSFIQLLFLILIRTEVPTVHKSLFFSINLCHTYSLGTAGGIIQYKDLEMTPVFIGYTIVAALRQLPVTEAHRSSGRALLTHTS